MLPDKDGESEADGETEADKLLEMDGLSEGLRLADKEADGETDDEMLADNDALRDGLGVPVNIQPSLFSVLAECPPAYQVATVAFELLRSK